MIADDFDESLADVLGFLTVSNSKLDLVTRCLSAHRNVESKASRV